MQANGSSEDRVDERVRKRLRELRRQRGFTLEEVAARSAIDVSTLSRLESGKRRLALDHLPAWPPRWRSAPTNCCGRRRPKTLAYMPIRTPVTA